MPEARVKEVTVSAAVGGKIQVVQFQYSADYRYFVSKSYEVSDMDDAEADEFWKTRLAELREELEPIAQKEVDELQELRDQLSQAGSSES